MTAIERKSEQKVATATGSDKPDVASKLKRRGSFTCKLIAIQFRNYQIARYSVFGRFFYLFFFLNLESNRSIANRQIDTFGRNCVCFFLFERIKVWQCYNRLHCFFFFNLI